MPHDDAPIEDLLRRRARDFAPSTAHGAGAPSSGAGAPGAELCSDAELLAAYAEGSLGAAPRERFERHLAACPACQMAVVRLVRLAPRESAAGRAAPAAQPAGRPGLFRWRWAVPALAGVVLAGSFVYYERSRLLAPEEPARAVLTAREPTAAEKAAEEQKAGAKETQPAEKPSSPRIEPGYAGGVRRGGSEETAAARASGRMANEAPPPAPTPAGAAPPAHLALPENRDRENVVKPPAAGVPAGAAAPAQPTLPSTQQTQRGPRVQSQPGGVGGALQGQAVQSEAAPAPPPLAAPQALSRTENVPLTAQKDRARADEAKMEESHAPAPELKQKQAPVPPMYRSGAGKAPQAEMQAKRKEQAAESDAFVPEPSEPAAARLRAAPESQAAEARRLPKILPAGSLTFALMPSHSLVTRSSAQPGPWKPLRVTPGTPIVDFSISGDNLWVLLPGGLVRHSPDLGATWDASVESGAEDGVTILFADSRNGEIVARSGLRLRTDDGGRSWKASK